MRKPTLERRSILESDNQEIVKKIRKDMESIKENWRCGKMEGILGAPFVDKACAMPEAAFVSAFMYVKPSSAKDIEALIRSGLISGNCYDCTDNQGFNEAWLYRMNDEVYDIELSHWCDLSFERQAAEQIFQLYQKKHKEDGQPKTGADRHPGLGSDPEIPTEDMAEIFSEANGSGMDTEVVAAIDPNGLEAQVYVHVLNVEKGTDIEEAARLAAAEFCRTTQGYETFRENNNCFNWGDFVYIPKDICKKYGFSPCYFAPAVTVDFNEQLVSDADVQEEHNRFIDNWLASTFGIPNQMEARNGKYIVFDENGTFIKTVSCGLDQEFHYVGPSSEEGTLEHWLKKNGLYAQYASSFCGRNRAWYEMSLQDQLKNLCWEFSGDGKVKNKEEKNHETVF